MSEPVLKSVKSLKFILWGKYVKYWPHYAMFSWSLTWHCCEDAEEEEEVRLLSGSTTTVRSTTGGGRKDWCNTAFLLLGTLCLVFDGVIFLVVWCRLRKTDKKLQAKEETIDYSWPESTNF